MCAICQYFALLHALQHWPRNVEHRTNIDKQRRTQAQLLSAATQWDLQFCTAHIIEAATNGIVLDLVAVGNRVINRDAVHNLAFLKNTLDTRPYTANIETAHLRLTQIEAIR